MKKIKKFLCIVLTLVLISLILSFFVDKKNIMIVLFSSILFIGYLVYKEKIGQELIIALLFASVITSYYIYEYTSLNIMFGKINLFPLISWTFGLVLLREIYEIMKGKNKFLKTSLFYLILLLIIEYLGYHFLNIRLQTNLPSLFGLGMIHAELGMKFFYIFAGPVYLLITDYLKVK
jgi:hypothetical protein